MTAAAGFPLVTAAFVVTAALGATARWWASVGTHRRWRDHLPLPTLLVNLAGSFALGCLAGGGLSSAPMTVLGTGFLGSFTTFSAFVRDGHSLVAAGDHRPAAVYLGLSIGGGVVAALIGLELGPNLPPFSGS